MKTKILLLGCFGYLGNQLYRRLSQRFDVLGIDNGSFGKFDYGELGDHGNLSKRELAQYDVIIILSGRSSVQLCPDSKLREIMEDNVYVPKSIFERTTDSQLIIYASSGSLCNKKLNANEDYTSLPAKCLYDFSKENLERIHLSKFGGRDIVGLRFGTVFGYSENFRNDTIFNKLFLECSAGKNIKINFPKVQRAFLSMTDLVAGIEKIVDCPTNGIYNLASFNCSFQELAEKFVEYYRQYYDIKVEYTELGENNYNFSMDTSKFKKRFEFSPSTYSIDCGITQMEANFMARKPIYCGGRV